MGFCVDKNKGKDQQIQHFDINRDLVLTCFTTLVLYIYMSLGALCIREHL